MVGFLREHLPRVYPNDATGQIKRLFGDAWDKGALDASRSRSTGGTNTAIRDAYDLLGVNHFYEIFDKSLTSCFRFHWDTPLILSVLSRASC